MEIVTLLHGEHSVADLVALDSADAGVLLWHGRGDAERLTMRRLAVELALDNIAVIVPDLYPSCDDPGLVDSLRHASEVFIKLGIEPDRRSIVGWSYGAKAAVAAALNPAIGSFYRAVGLSGNYSNLDPLGGRILLEQSEVDDSAEVCLVHGGGDQINDVEGSKAMQRHLDALGVSVSFTNVAGGHATPILATYQPVLQICVPSEDLAPGMSAALGVVADFAQLGLQALPE